jgi:hypothetical protein
LETEHVTEANPTSTATTENNNIANEVPTQRDNIDDTPPNATMKQPKTKGKGRQHTAQSQTTVNPTNNPVQTNLPSSWADDVEVTHASGPSKTIELIPAPQYSIFNDANLSSQAEVYMSFTTHCNTLEESYTHRQYAQRD